MPAKQICPECGKELRHDEDAHGVTYQCLAHDCLSLFSQDEIEVIPPNKQEK